MGQIAPYVPGLKTGFASTITQPDSAGIVHLIGFGLGVDLPARNRNPAAGAGMRREGRDLTV